jgi:hypothetical protein
VFIRSLLLRVRLLRPRSDPTGRSTERSTKYLERSPRTNVRPNSTGTPSAPNAMPSMRSAGAPRRCREAGLSSPEETARGPRVRGRLACRSASTGAHRGAVLEIHREQAGKRSAGRCTCSRSRARRWRAEPFEVEGGRAGLDGERAGHGRVADSGAPTTSRSAGRGRVGASPPRSSRPGDVAIQPRMRARTCRGRVCVRSGPRGPARRARDAR